MIRKRGDKWVVRMYDRKTRKQAWVGTFDSKQEAQHAEAKAILGAKKRRQEVETCDSFADRWIDDYPRQRESSNIGYRQAIKAFREEFKGIPLDELDRVRARRWALQHPGGAKAARAMFSDAKRDGICDDNPFLDLRLPGSKGRKDDDIPTLDDIYRIAEEARVQRGPIFEAFVLAAAFTGMRPGELYALRWPDIRLGDLEIDVTRSYSTRSGQTTLPKNGKRRTIVLPAPARDALRRIKPPAPREFDPVFTTPRGKPLTGRTLAHHWVPIRTAAGFHGLDFYSLRHFCATYLLNVLGIPAHQVAAQLGHTDGGVLVMKLYGHPSAQLAREAIKRAFAESNVVELPRRFGSSEASSS